MFVLKSLFYVCGRGGSCKRATLHICERGASCSRFICAFVVDLSGPRQKTVVGSNQPYARMQRMGSPFFQFRSTCDARRWDTVHVYLPDARTSDGSHEAQAYINWCRHRHKASRHLLSLHESETRLMGTPFTSICFSARQLAAAN